VRQSLLEQLSKVIKDRLRNPGICSSLLKLHTKVSSILYKNHMAIDKGIGTKEAHESQNNSMELAATLGH